MSKTIKQLKNDKIYLLKIIKLFDGRVSHVDLIVCKQYKEELKNVQEEIRILEDG